MKKLFTSAIIAILFAISLSAQENMDWCEDFNAWQTGEWLGKGYKVDCLPEYYQQIIWFLTEKLVYVICDYDDRISYNVDDSSKISITKLKREIKGSELK